MPETAGDYERLLVATPNDSLLWVKFMAFKLSLADVEVRHLAFVICGQPEMTAN